ncbi:hypothetical protein ENTB43_087 [Enterobacter phage Entb_43]|nr:hypothetical protein ENTB43_087 [Enterobacter phage Entb_43]
MIHLVKVKYRISEYMVDDDLIVSKLFTVDADDTIEAENKIYKHFDNLSDPYDTSYWVIDCDFVEHIE